MYTKNPYHLPLNINSTNTDDVESGLSISSPSQEACDRASKKKQPDQTENLISDAEAQLASPICASFLGNLSFLAGNYLLCPNNGVYNEIACRFIPALPTFVVGSFLSVLDYASGGDSSRSSFKWYATLATIGPITELADAGLSCIPGVPSWAPPIITTVIVAAGAFAIPKIREHCSGNHFSFWHRESAGTTTSTEERSLLAPD